jgi:hypothetical protein
MKIIAFIFMVLLSACNPESSPEGRSRIIDKKLKDEISILKAQSRDIRDSIRKINEELRLLKNVKHRQ